MRRLQFLDLIGTIYLLIGTGARNSFVCLLREVRYKS